jgi:tripartite-type tricarboxylate transporter receptor subunit TctC
VSRARCEWQDRFGPSGTVGGIAISPALYNKLPYDPQRDLLPITRVAEIINVMVVNPSTGAKNVKDSIDWAKKRQGDVRFGSSGTGQPDHLAGEFFQRLAGLRMSHIPYKGGGPALIDLVSGDLQLMFATYVVGTACRDWTLARSRGDCGSVSADTARAAGNL